MTPLQLKNYLQAMGFSATLTNGSRSIIVRFTEDITSAEVSQYLDRTHWHIIDQIINMRRWNDDSFDYVQIRLKEVN